jgi:hypothetical protein
MTNYAMSDREAGQLLSTGPTQRKTSIGHRMLNWIETNQQRRADRELAKLFRPR